MEEDQDLVIKVLLGDLKQLSCEWKNILKEKNKDKLSLTSLKIQHGDLEKKLHKVRPTLCL